MILDREDHHLVVLILTSNYIKYYIAIEKRKTKISINLRKIEVSQETGADKRRKIRINRKKNQSQDLDHSPNLTRLKKLNKLNKNLNSHNYQSKARSVKFPKLKEPENLR